MVTPGQLARRAQLFNQLGTSLGAGLTLIKSLELAVRTRSTGVAPQKTQQLIHFLQQGDTFANAMQRLSGQLPADHMHSPVKVSRGQFFLSEFDRALLTVGEETGRLDSSFKTLARHYETQARIVRETIAKLAFTLITLHFFLLIFPLGFLTEFVLGIVNSDYQRCLPFVIEKIVAFGCLYAVIFGVFFAGQGNRSEGFKSFIESIFSWTPGLGKALKYLALARLATALHALQRAGVSVPKSWELGAQACGSPKLKKAILLWMPELQHGTTPAEMIAQIPYFPEMFTQLYASSELTGSQDDTLQRLEVYFEEEGFRKLQTFATLLSLAIYLLIAGVIGYNIIRFWLNYYNNLLNSV